MPRKRIDRPFRGAGRPAIEAVERNLDDPWWCARLGVESFYNALPTPEEREAYRQLEPQAFYLLWGFESRSWASVNPIRS
jgi:hypothetical protein